LGLEPANTAIKKQALDERACLRAINLSDGRMAVAIGSASAITQRRTPVERVHADRGGACGEPLYLCYCMYKLRFEWDEAKNRQNRRKHGVDFEVAALVFDDANHRSEQDRVVNGEERWQTIGLVKELLLVCHTWTEEDVVRIVSARKANGTERNRYYHGHRPL